MQYNLKKMNTDQILELFLKGEELRCPYPGCNKVLEHIPKELVKGSLPIVLRCPESEQHFLIYVEPAGAMNEVREKMLARIKASKK